MSACGPEVWSRIEDLLDQLLETPEWERSAVLARAERDDLDVARETAALLAAMAFSGGDLLDRPFSSTFPHLLSDLESSGKGLSGAPLESRRLGSYRLVRVLGHGGMGVVYLAERDDRQFEKQVAIKLVPWHLQTPETVRRFTLERNVLARLEHPNIARLLDGGVTEEGHPYLVMELIDGEPIDAYCGSRSLGLRDRLELFLGVCDAVQYAHQNLVIHRDIKPANILVTPEGKVKLLDFGVAKLTGETEQATLASTHVQPRTPAYAAPEQIANRGVSTASDAYSLGVLLYRLLTGRHPYPLDGLSPSDAEAVVRERAPVRPSTAALGATSWSRRLRGDLDRILLKALEKEPARRYPTPEALAEDLRRYRRGLPVLARDPTLGYRARKLVTRHRVAATAAAVVVLAVAVTFGGIAWQARRAAHEAERATVVAELLTSIFADGDPYEGSGREMTVLELLDRGLSRVREQFAAEPGIRSDLLSALAKAYQGQGRIETAVELQREALDDRRRLYGERDARVLESMALLGGALHVWGRYDDAEALLAETLKRVESISGADSEEASDVLLQLGMVHETKGDYAGAGELFRESLRIRRRLASGPDFGVAAALVALSGSLDLSGHDEEALELLGEALRISEETVGEDHPYTGSMRNNLGVRLQEFGDLEEASRHYHRALEIQEKRLGSDAIGTADASNNLGNVLMALGDFEGAQAHVERAVKINRASLEATNFSRIVSEINLATLRFEQGALEEAEALYREGLQRFEALFGESHQRTARVRTLLARCLHLAGKMEEAESQFRRSLDAHRATEDPMKLPETLIGLGTVLVDSGRAQEAETLLREALDQRLAQGRPTPWRVAEVKLELGGALLRQGRADEAKELLRAGAAVLVETLPAENFRQERCRRLLDELQAATSGEAEASL